MQAAYDTWHAEREEDVSAIPTIKTERLIPSVASPTFLSIFHQDWRPGVRLRGG